MWSLGKVLDTPEVARVYVGSFWDQPLKNEKLRELFEQEAGAFKPTREIYGIRYIRKSSNRIEL